jgi:hypothetical protein
MPVTFLVAQSLLEYGMVSLKSSMQLLSYSIRDWFNQATPATWLMIGGFVVGVLWLWSRRS